MYFKCSCLLDVIFSQKVAGDYDFLPGTSCCRFLFKSHAISINLCLLGCNGGNAVSAFEHIVRFLVDKRLLFRTILRSFVLISRRKEQMATEHVLEDKELGRLLVRVNVRARRLTFRTREDVIHVTVPPGTTIGEVKNAVEQLRPRLRAARQQQSRPLIDLDYRIDTEFFKLSLVGGERDRFLSRSELGEMLIICPPDADFSNKELQAWLRKVIEEALRRNAKIILPPRLYALSLQHNLSYKSVKINSSSGRWGSCSARGNINLSYFLVLLPKHLIDYVLLHELAHTREMNHGERFWALLDGMTDGKAQLLRSELRKYKTDF